MSGVSKNGDLQVAGSKFYAADQRQKTSYNAPLLWILGGAAAVSSLAYLYFGNEENENPYQLADVGSMLTDIAVSAGAIAASIASIPLTIYATIMAAKDDQVNFNNDLSNRDLQKVDHLSEELVNPFDQLPSLQAQSGKYKRDRSNRNSKRGTSQNNPQRKQQKAKKTRAGSGSSPMIPKTEDITLNSGSYSNGYSSKVLSNGNIATVCARSNKIYLNIDNSAGSVVSAPMLISDDKGNYPDLVQELTSENIGIAWIDTSSGSMQYTIHSSQGQIIKPRTEVFASTEYIGSRRCIGVKGDNFFSFHNDGEYIYWQEIASSDGNLVGSLINYQHSTFAFPFEFPEPDEMAMVQAANGNMIAMYKDKFRIMRRQAFTLGSDPVGANYNLDDSKEPDLVVVGNKSFGVRRIGAIIFLDKLNQDGSADGGSVTVATDATGNPRIATNGNFIAVAYQAPDGSGNGAFARIYDNDGVPIEDAFCANDNTVGEQTEPQLSWTPDGDLTVFFKDSSGIPTMRTFKFNSPPVPNNVPPETVFINQPFTKTYAAGALATDPDGHSIAFTDEGGVPWGIFNETSLTLNVTAPPGSQGNHNRFFGGDDGYWNGTFSGGQIPIYVANRAPTITGDATVSGFPLEQMGPVCLTTSDLDLDTPLTTGMTGRGVLNGTDCWTFTPGSDDVGTGTVNATVTDPLGAKGYHLFDWTVNNRLPFVNKGFGQHAVTAGHNFAIVVDDEAYGDLDGHVVRVEDFGELENWIIPNIGTQSLTGRVPGGAFGKTFNVHPTFCDSYASCTVDRTGLITVFPEDGHNELPALVRDYPEPNPIGSGWDFSYHIDVRDFVIDPEGDQLLASVKSSFGVLPEWFKSSVTSDVIVDFWGKAPDDFVGSVTPVIEVRDSEHPSGVSEPVAFNVVTPDALIPRMGQLINDLFFNVGTENWIPLDSGIFISPVGSSITLSMEKESAELDSTLNWYKKIKWLKLKQDNQGNWLIGGMPGKKATNGVKVTLQGCDIHNLCATQQFFARVHGMSTMEEFATYVAPFLVASLSSAAVYYFKYGRNGEWRNHKRTVVHYCGQKKDQMEECWSKGKKNTDIPLQDAGNKGLLGCA